MELSPTRRFRDVSKFGEIWLIFLLYTTLFLQSLSYLQNYGPGSHVQLLDAFIQGKPPPLRRAQTGAILLLHPLVSVPTWLLTRLFFR